MKLSKIILIYLFHKNIVKSMNILFALQTCLRKSYDQRYKNDFIRK